MIYEILNQKHLQENVITIPNDCKGYFYRHMRS